MRQNSQISVSDSTTYVLSTMTLATNLEEVLTRASHMCPSLLDAPRMQPRFHSANYYIMPSLEPASSASETFDIGLSSYLGGDDIFRQLDRFTIMPSGLEPGRDSEQSLPHFHQERTAKCLKGKGAHTGELPSTWYFLTFYSRLYFNNLDKGNMKSRESKSGLFTVNVKRERKTKRLFFKAMEKEISPKERKSQIEPFTV